MQSSVEAVVLVVLKFMILAIQMVQVQSLVEAVVQEHQALMPQVPRVGRGVLIP